MLAAIYYDHWFLKQINFLNCLLLWIIAIIVFIGISVIKCIINNQNQDYYEAILKLAKTCQKGFKLKFDLLFVFYTIVFILSFINDNKLNTWTCLIHMITMGTMYQFRGFVIDKFELTPKKEEKKDKKD